MEGGMDNTLATRTADLLSLADVHRWTVVRTLRHQSVAEHSFGVAVIAMELYIRFLHEPGSRLRTDLGSKILQWSLLHDVPETLTGDIDGRFKLEYPELAEEVRAAEEESFPWYATEAEEAKSTPVEWIVKAADKIEGIAFIRQWGWGDRADGVYHEMVGILNRKVVPKLTEALEMDGDAVVHIVNMVMNRILSQTYNYQNRNGSVETMQMRAAQDGVGGGRGSGK